ncbi:hypothetical protein ACFLWX_04050 [Chloroflexota bacterium]
MCWFILGCGHRGIANTLQRTRELTGTELVYAIIGGTHLFRASQERVELTITDLMEIGIQRLGVSHCTGFPASVRMVQELRNVFFLNHASTHLTLPKGCRKGHFPWS